MTAASNITGVLAEYDSPAALLAAAKRVREAGYSDFDAHSPFPIHGMDQAMGMKRSVLGWLVGLMATFGVLGAIGLQWWTSSVDYKFVISGKPFFSFQAYVPITFGIGVLLAAVTAVFGMFHFNRLPRLNHPVFTSEHFKKMSTGSFFVSIEATDAKFDDKETVALLQTIGAVHVELLHD